MIIKELNKKKFVWPLSLELTQNNKKVYNSPIWDAAEKISWKFLFANESKIEFNSDEKKNYHEKHIIGENLI